MREFFRPAIVCPSCKVNIATQNNWNPQASGQKAVVAQWTEPPSVSESCPVCHKPVDTSAAYAALPSFPPSFENLKGWYSGFEARWERHRDSFENRLLEWLEQGSLTQIADQLSLAEGMAWYQQRLFYRSSVSFYRSLKLFLGYLQLDRKSFRTWTDVTGYYSRFYFLQAFLNLCGATTFELPSKANPGRGITYFDGTRIRSITPIPKAFGNGSHERWWGLMEALKRPQYPVQQLDFVLTRLVYSPSERNRINYGFEYQIGGFPELEWADSGAAQMLNHFSPSPRIDRDFTDVNRFFAGVPDDVADEGDFFGDSAQILWASLQAYLVMLKQLAFPQSFVQTETILALCDVHIGDDYPQLIQGIAQEVHRTLQDGYDIEPFLAHYRGSEHPGSVQSASFEVQSRIFPRHAGTNKSENVDL